MPLPPSQHSSSSLNDSKKNVVAVLIFILYVNDLNFSCVHLIGGSLTMFVLISSWLLDKGKHFKVRITNSDNSFSIVFSLLSLNVRKFHCTGKLLCFSLVCLINVTRFLSSLLDFTVMTNCHGHLEGNVISCDI